MKFSTIGGKIFNFELNSEKNALDITYDDVFLGSFFIENAQALKGFLNANLPEVIVNEEINDSHPATVDGNADGDINSDPKNDGDDDAQGSAQMGDSLKQTVLGDDGIEAGQEGAVNV